MVSKTYRVKQVAQISGVTVRTLHHYDHIGLLSPHQRSEAAYRLYTDDDLLRLQQILLCREMGLPLERIRQMLDEPGYDRIGALADHRERLEAELEVSHARLRSVDTALAALKGVEDMNAKEIFDGFDPKDHEAEVKERFGDTDAYKEAALRTKRYTAEDWKTIRAENDVLMKRVAEHLAGGSGASSEPVVALAESHRRHIDRWYYPCSREMHAGLAQMYVADERFRASFDKHGDGLAGFLAEAIRTNAARPSGE